MHREKDNFKISSEVNGSLYKHALALSTIYTYTIAIVLEISIADRIKRKYRKSNFNTGNIKMVQSCALFEMYFQVLYQQEISKSNFLIRKFILSNTILHT